MNYLILMRHGQSVWNKLNIFTGWVDVPLSKEGITEALQAGEEIKDLPIDIIFTTTLVRAQTTTFLAMSHHYSNKTPVVKHFEESKLGKWGKIYNEQTEAETIPVIYTSELNERYYGELQGKDKREMAEEYGEDQIKTWRRSFDIAPPQGESLQMTTARSVPYFKEHIYPLLLSGKNVLVVAHGNSLRSLIMELDQLNTKEITQVELATAKPLIYIHQQGIIARQTG